MNDIAVITFGRFNPIHIGHEKLVDSIQKIAREKQAIPYLFMSHTCDRKKNPFSYNTKIQQS